MKKNFKYKFQKKNILRHLSDRSLGLINITKPTSITNIEKHLPFFWTKTPIETDKHNKIFASQWITNDSVVYGTKCNRLYWLNVEKQNSFQIPLIQGISRDEQQNAHTDEPSTNFGIHAIKKNLSETLLATGGENVNSVGIYIIPEFKPQFILEKFHSDAIFDICWLDDSHVATCSRDSKMGIWRINPETVKFDYEYYTRSPIANNRWIIDDSIIGALHKPQSQFCFEGTQNRFRAMEYLQSTNRLLIATMSNKLYSFDPSLPMNDCERVFSFKTVIQDMVAIRKWPIHPHSFAVGGQARFAIYDSRKQGEGMNVLALNQSAGIRSLAFKDYVISYGTAEGHINFFDLRAHRHLEATSFSHSHLLGSALTDTSPYYTCFSPPTPPPPALPSMPQALPPSLAVPSLLTFMPTTPEQNCTFNNLLQLRMEGVVEQSDLGRALSYPQTAIYTHEYDPTRTKLFAAGGPIAACYTGQAACLFE